MRKYSKKKDFVYRQYKTISVVLVFLLLFFTSGAFAQESSVYDITRNRIISAYSYISDTDNIIAIEVSDLSGNLVDPLNLTIDNNPENIITNSLDENFSLAYDSISARAYISYTNTSEIHEVVVIDLSLSTPPPPQLSVSPPSLSFPDTDVGTSSSSQNITVTNSGDGQLTITGVVGPLTSHFNTIDNCISSVLGNGDTCTISVKFTPQSVGFKSDSITIITDNGDNDQVQITGTGQSSVGSPVLSVSPTSLNFGTVTVNDPSYLSVTVTNTGNADLYISKVTRPSDHFSKQNDTCTGATLAPVTGSCSVTIRFTPTAETTYNGRFTIRSDSDSGKQTVKLSGSGQSSVGSVGSPVLSVNPSSLNFGTVIVDNPSYLSVTVTNIGDADLTVTSVDGFTPSVFTLDSNSCTSPVTPGNTCNISVRFTPAANMAYNGSFSIQSDSDEGNQAVSLSGTGQSSVGNPGLSVNPSSLNFGTVTVDNPSYLSVTVTNTGDADLTVTSVDGFTPSEFTLDSNGCTSPVAPGNSCDISVSFTPAAETTYNGNFTIQSDGGNQTATVSGTGQNPPSPQISVNPLILNFGTVTVGNSSTGNVTVTNIGTASLTVTSVDGFTPSEFTLDSNGCTSPVTPGNTCNISVRFTPAADMAYNGSFTIQSDGGNQTVNLSGTGQSGGPPDTNVTLAWDAPTTNEDGTPLTDLAGYVVYYGTSSGSYTESIDVGNVTGTTIDNLSSGTWCFAVTAFDISGNESELSDEVCKDI